jgi:hypothetical protein
VSQTSHDAKAIVRALDALTTEVRRIADARQTPVVRVGDDVTTTADDGEATCPTPLTHNWGCGCPTDEAPAAHTQTLRWARRESLLVLVTRVQHGRTLTENEARTLRHHVETEMREAEQVRAKADEATATLRRVRSALATLKERGAVGRAYYRAITEALAGPCPDGTEQPTTEA